MTHDKIKRILQSMVIVVDTREHLTPEFLQRVKDTGLPYTRRKLDFGDYACMVTLDTGQAVSFEKCWVVERKMSLDELAQCFTGKKNRERFEAEFVRAKEARAKTYLLIENGSVEQIIQHSYSSQMYSNALLASLFAFLARYNCVVIFCPPNKTGRIIREIMTREATERLTRYD